MKFTTIIAPLFLLATLADAKSKKPKLPKNGGGSGQEETTAVEDQVQETETGFMAQATSTGSRDVGEIISSFYPTQGVPTLAPAISTSLASGLISVESSWFNSPEYTSANNAIDSALPLSLAASVAVSGYVYGDIITESWFINGVPKTIQSEVKGYLTAIESVHYKYVTATATQTSAPTGTSRAQATSANGAMITAAPLGIAGVVGIAGAIVAAVL